MYNNNALKSFREVLSAYLAIRGNGTLLFNKTGISRSLINQYKAGKAVPGLDKAEQIANAMGVTLGELLGFTEKIELTHPIEECLRRVSRAIKEQEDIMGRVENLPLAKKVEIFLALAPTYFSSIPEDQKEQAAQSLKNAINLLTRGS